MSLDNTAMRGLIPPHQAADFVFAGNATVTVVSKRTGKRFTIRVRRLADMLNIYEVFLLVGPNNESDLLAVGTYSDDIGYRFLRNKPGPGTHGRGPTWAIRAWTAQPALRWFFANLRGPKLAQCEVWHEGRCGACGRKLTVPSSIADGFGPECAAKVALATI